MDEKIWNLLFDNIKKVLFPEAWLIMDLQITKLELIALLLLWRTDEIIMSQLAESINIPMSTATGVINRLAKGGYVERLTDESNRRIVTVKLTSKGRETADSIKETIIKYWDHFTGMLTGDEKEMLLKLFSRIIAMLDGKSVDDTPDEENSVKKIHID